MLADSLFSVPHPESKSTAADEFDEALKKLRAAKKKLDRAANLYIERLEGTRRERTP